MATGVIVLEMITPAIGNGQVQSLHARTGLQTSSVGKVLAKGTWTREMRRPESKMNDWAHETSRIDSSTTSTMAQSATTELLWDQATALKNVGGDLGDLKDLLAISLEQSPQLLANMASAIERSSSHELYLAAHTLKSSLQLFGMTTCAALAESLELAGRMNQWENVPHQLCKLNETIEQLRPVIQAFVGARSD